MLFRPLKPDELLQVVDLQLIAINKALTKQKVSVELNQLAKQWIVDNGYDVTAPPREVFAGWMFSSSPAVSAMEHPVYDITLLSCKPD